MKKIDHQIGVGGLILEKEEKYYLNKVIENSRLSYGPITKEFENLFSREHDSKYGIFCNSGTSALHIAIATLKEKYLWNDNDEIIVPSTTFIATSNVVVHNNMIPIFVDVEKTTYNIDPDLIEENISSKTKAIIPVHLFGCPAEMEKIIKIARKYDLKIIEDSCETMFANYKGKKVGSFGDIGCFSTYVAHFLVTGIGGFCITNDEEIALILRSLMNHGRDISYISIDDDKKRSKEEMNKIVNNRFKFVRLGHSFRATELEAAIGLGQLSKKDTIIKRRKEIAKKYMDGLKHLKEHIQLPTVLPDRDHNFMMFPIVMKNSSKNDIVKFLEESNIETRDMLPLLNQPVYDSFNLDLKKFPISSWILKSGFYIGCHQYISDDEIEYILSKFNEFFRSA
ncbi:MAG: DegT/DnrJ/EryC1/StrS family aminotransferase [Desulfobacula sp.]|nr:DegT/DnrJ/EryC1/StrS family aminotransferase [Desulfobacula sp.]